MSNIALCYDFSLFEYQMKSLCRILCPTFRVKGPFIKFLIALAEILMNKSVAISMT